MAKVKPIQYDVSDVEDMGDFKPAPVGLYRAKIAQVEVGKSKSDQPMLTVVLELTHDSKGKKLKESYGRIWHRVPLDKSNPGWTWRLKELIKALGLKAKGKLDPSKIEGEELLVKLRSGKDLDDEYRPEVSKLMAPDEEAEDEEPDEDEDEDEDEEDEDEDEEDEDEDEDEEDEEEEDDEEEDDEDEDEDEDYSDLSRNQLIKEARSRSIKVTKKMDEDAIREALISDDSEDEDEDEDEEDEDEEQDYSEWDVDDLKAELKERGLKVSGNKSTLVKRLEKDDESGDEPF